ncbi:glucose-6-phosphate isomerase, partial [bacterium]|nr:glucose-6-phosphate isomerase [bacterium]
GGAISNPDENRMVGHYWLRNSELAPTPEIRKAIDDAQDQLVDFANKIHEGYIRPEKAERFTHVLVVGIGGSALGPQFVSDALRSASDPLKVHFFDNTDPDGMDRVISEINGDMHRTLVLVLSKSGGTKETRNGMLEIQNVYDRMGLKFGKHAVAVTGDGSELYKYAKIHEWLAILPMWDWVGGRTSETSVVGLLPAALQGLVIGELLNGAADMDSLTRKKDIRQNPAALLALAWYKACGGHGKKDMVILPYCDRLCLLGRYLQQLIMESLGKDKDLEGNLVHQGLTVYGNKGSTDQHAYVQQLRDGIDNFFINFIAVLRNRFTSSMEVEEGITTGDYLSGFWQGTRQAITESGRASILLTIPEVNAYTIGQLIALYERTVGLYAFLIGINAYHQPGVEAGKKAAGKILQLQAKMIAAIQKAKQPLSVEEIAEAVGETDLEKVFHIARHLAANNRAGIVQDSITIDGRFLVDPRLV